MNDLKLAVRSLRKTPALAAIGIASLALGIGANVTIFSVVREMILDDFSARAPDRLTRIGADISYGQYRDLRQAGVFEDLAFDTGFGDLTWNAGTRKEVAWRMATSANFFDVLGVSASSGRLYSHSDEGLPVAVISYGFWRKRLDSDPHAVGGVLDLSGKLYKVLGVLPRDYRSILGHGVSPELYLIAPSTSRHCHPFGRLRDGFTRNQTRQSLMAVAAAIGGESFAKLVANLAPMGGLAGNASKGGDDRLFFLFFAALFGTAAILAIIAFSNVAALLLARGLTRQRDLAICKALGANRFQVARQLLAEGLVLIAFGAGAGLLIDAFLRNRLSFVRWPSAYNLPFEFHFQSDRGLLLYALATALAALLASSLIPALRGSNANLGLAMKQSEPAFSIRRWNLRNGFVVLQVALSVVLLTLGVLFFRSFWKVAGEGPGFDVSHEVIAVVHPLPEAHLQGESGWNWRDGVVRGLKRVPGVTGVTSIGTLPFMGELPQNPVRRKGEPVSAASDAYIVGGGEEFCNVLGIPVLRGRDFEVADRTRQPVPVLVNQTLARRLFGDSEPIGSQLAIGREHPQIIEIIGVTADARMRTLGESHSPLLFTPFADAQLIVRVSGNAAQWVRPLRKVLDQVDRTAAIDVRPLSDAAAGALFPMRVAAGFLGALAGLALLLVLTGLYSSVSYATGRRTREMAIRTAIGATRSDIVWTAIRDGLAVLTCGVVLGLPLAIGAIRPLTDIFPDGVNPWNAGMFAGVCLLMLATGAGAAWIPARGAAKVEPSLALRQD